MKLGTIFILITVANLAVACGGRSFNFINSTDFTDSASSTDSIRYTYDHFYNYDRECMDSTKRMEARGRIVNDREEGLWIFKRPQGFSNYDDSLYYKDGMLHGLCIYHEFDTRTDPHQNKRSVWNYVEDKKHGESCIYFEDGTRTTVTYVNDSREGDEITYDKQGNEMNVTRYKDDIECRFMSDYHMVREFCRKNDERFFFREGEFEYVTHEGYNNYDFRKLNINNRSGGWIKFHNTIPVEYVCFDKSGMIEYCQEVSEHSHIKGNYKRYRDGVLIESGWSVEKDGMKKKSFEDFTTKEKIIGTAVVAGVVAVAVLTVKGGGKLPSSFGGGSDDAENGYVEKEPVYYSNNIFILNGPITYYNTDGTINRIENYVDGELVE